MDEEIDRLVPAKWRGKILENYYIDSKTGDIWSNRGGKFKKLKWYLSANTIYPAKNLMHEGRTVLIRAHRLVAETLHPIPLPAGVTEKEWKRTPASVKKLVSQLWEVNHIDHNRNNYSPDNLEWVFRHENLEKYKEHVAKNKT